MSLFAGLERTDYQDALRAVGRLLDREGWRDLRLVEDEAGLIVQVRAADLLSGWRAYRLTVDDCLALLRDAYAARGLRPLAAGPAPPRPTLAGAVARRAPRFPLVEERGYQAVLRGLGRLLDQRGWRAVRVVEGAGLLVVQARAAHHPRPGFLTRALTPEQARTLLAWAPGPAAGPPGG